MRLPLLGAWRRFAHQYLMVVPQYGVEIHELSPFCCAKDGCDLTEAVTQALLSPLSDKTIVPLDRWFAAHLPRDRPFQDWVMCPNQASTTFGTHLQRVTGRYSLVPLRSAVPLQRQPLGTLSRR